MENSQPTPPLPNLSQTDEPPVTPPGQESPPPGSPPITQGKKKLPKILIYLLVVAALLTLGAGGFWLYQKKTAKPAITSTIPTPIPTLSLPTSTPAPKSAIPADWKTFSSRKNYQIKYPNTLIYEERVPGFYVFLENPTNPTSQLFYIDERGEKTLTERKEWQKDNLTEATYTDIPIAGTQGFIVEGKAGPGYGEGLQIKNAYIDLNGKELIIGCDTNETCQNQTLDQILSTFKFLDEDDKMADWKTYTDSDNRYQFRYPPSFELGKLGDSLPLLNHRIYWRTSDYSYKDCLGDCPMTTFEETLTIDGQPATKRKGWVGSVAGNIPQSFIEYEIQYPNTSKYFIITLWELIQDGEWNQMGQLYPDNREIKDIPKEDEQVFGQILSTFKFLN